MLKAGVSPVVFSTGSSSSTINPSRQLVSVYGHLILRGGVTVNRCPTITITVSSIRYIHRYFQTVRRHICVLPTFSRQRINNAKQTTLRHPHKHRILEPLESQVLVSLTSPSSTLSTPFFGLTVEIKVNNRPYVCYEDQWTGYKGELHLLNHFLL